MDPKLVLERFLTQRNTLSYLFNRPTIDSDDYQTNWPYSKPVVIVDVLWNLAFVLVSLILLFSTFQERPSTPLRLWIAGYAFQCVLHVAFVYFDHRRRISGGGDDDLLYGSSQNRRGSAAKRLESVNTMFSFFWWMMGFYWIVVGGQALLQDAPRLYWLAVIFLAFDVFFAILCVAFACLIGIALCCCFPCLVLALYAIGVRDGASEDVIRILPSYRFRQCNEPQVSGSAMMKMESGDDHISEISLPAEDSECCICLTKYVDGVKLHSLHCGHLFHCECIVKWLRISATCPLCKYNIASGDELV
ncbi:hypothetical protein IFM89_036801 [Coptis chinensis]|uniref:RING-type E3 ubiquitin transferase n=1 Tax=Coptis chinensis TaxID=261450 RepID=A0A835HJ87_9MAGN|nr:hypothetical protein IFM89_036801 [Coptis chinensis]